MKNKSSIFILSLFILCLVSCENPFFIKNVGLYKVDFKTNGGTPVESIRTNKLSEIPYTEKADNSFRGWYTSSSYQGEALSFPLEIKEDTTLYAKWQQNYSVSFETNGGTPIESYKTGVFEESPETTKSNCEFCGWFTTADFSGNKISFPFEITKPTTLYAKWLVTYQVDFEENGGSLIDSYRAAIVEKAPESLRDGYTLCGWYYDSELSKPVEFPCTLIEDTIFYAKWQQKFKVTFDSAGGTKVASLETGFIESAPEPTLKDKTFAGWYLDSGYAEETKIEFPYTVTHEITLYAKWTAIQCTVTYYENGATGGTVPSSVKVDKGGTYTVCGNTGGLEKTGYAFTKWNTRADGNGQGYSAGNSITVTGDVALYAQWGKDYGAMVTVPGGWFYFGDPSEENRPKITLSSFQIAKYELTYELWLEVYSWAKENGYNLTYAYKGYATNDRYKSFVPATHISWDMACVWLNAYSEYKGYEPVYYHGNVIWKDDTNTSGYLTWKYEKNGFRLPTECEWEFAAGGGSAEEHDKYKYSGSNSIDEVAWLKENSDNETHPVGTKKANILNIYDMNGNVAEWCYDGMADFGSGELTNPIHNSSYYHIVRGLDAKYNYNQYSTIYNRFEGYENYNEKYHIGSHNNIYSDNGILGIRIARNVK